MTAPTREEICIVALADAFRGDGEILVSPIGDVPRRAALLARATFAPDILLTDGVAYLVDARGAIEGWMPYRAVFDVVWSGRRHVVMGASQLDRHGNQNLSRIGDARRPRVQLIGMRGAPGNTVCHVTSYWIPDHSPRVLVERVDAVCGIGYDRAAELGAGGRFHELRRVVTNLAVLDFATPDRRMRLASVHPGVTVDEVVAATGFELVIPDRVPETRSPTRDELALLREAPR